MTGIFVSLVAPAHNEADNLQLFCRQIFAELKKITDRFEIIVVDDGSTDKSFPLLVKLKKSFTQIRIVRLRRSYGQTAALMAGFGQAQGQIIVTMDADLQQNPKDIKKIIDPIIKHGVDAVSGKRPVQKRALIYTIISRVEKYLIRAWLKIDLEDTNVSPNAYKREALKDINLVGEMHRFLIPLLALKGYQIASVPTDLRSRRAGQSNYKPTKAVKGFLDLLMVKFWHDYSVRPIHFFGGLGLSLIFFGGLTGIFVFIRKFVFDLTLFNVSFLLLSIFLILIGLQCFIFGILADVLVRIYFKNTPNYQIDKVL